MNVLLRLIILICLVFAGQSHATTTAVAYGYEANSFQAGVENINNNGLINPSGCCRKLSSRDSQDQARSFFAFAADFYVPKSPAQRLADKVQNLPSAQRPNTVAVIKHSDGTITVGRNQGGVQNATVQNALDNAPQNCFAGQCAEINAISRALNKGRSLEGAEISISNVRGAASTSGVHGTPKPPCATCSNVLDQFDINH